VTPGLSLGRFEEILDPTLQFERYDTGLISDPLPEYRTGEKWGAPVAAPCTFVQYFWGPPTRTLRPLVSDAVGLFGAIEIGHRDGPLLLGQPYLIESEVIAVGQSPKTEYVWFDTSARRPDGALVATFRMMLRFMKASSPLYAA
jgi:hypothetical protein